MNWYLIILVIATDPLPGSISYPSPAVHIIPPPYATAAACQADAAKFTTMPLPAGRKHAFTCIQLP
jgi:hypothetical protein